MDDYVIDLKQLLAYILRRWLLIIVCMVVVGCALVVLKNKPGAPTQITADVATEARFITNSVEIEKRTHQIEGYDAKIKTNEMAIAENETKLNELKKLDLSDGKVQEAIVTVESYIHGAKGDITTNKNLKKVAEAELEVYKAQRRQIEANFKKAYGITYDEYMDGKTTLPGSSPTTKSKLKFGIIGAIVGAFLGVVISLVFYFFNGKLKDVKKLKYGYELEIIRMIYPYTGKKRCFYHKWIDKLEGYSKAKKTAEEEYDMAMSKLARVASSRSLVLSGLVDDSCLKKVAESLEASKFAKDYNFTVMTNPVEAPIELDLTDKQIVITLDRQCIKEKDLEEMVQTIKLAGGKLVGAILV